jgi:hypothetical protein
LPYDLNAELAKNPCRPGHEQSLIQRLQLSQIDRLRDIQNPRPWRAPSYGHPSHYAADPDANSWDATMAVECPVRIERKAASSLRSFKHLLLIVMISLAMTASAAADCELHEALSGATSLDGNGLRSSSTVSVAQAL